ncbi:MAG: PAS domain S-box protein [Dehalococcoidia bacterium]
MNDGRKTKKQLIEELTQLRRQVGVLELSDVEYANSTDGAKLDIIARKTAEEELSRRSAELTERVKELNCLYRIDELARELGTNLDTFMKDVLDVIVESWQYPEITEARITYKRRQYHTPGFSQSQRVQEADFNTTDGTGSVKVGYREERSEVGEGPFLIEERILINSIARRIGLFIDHKQSRDERERILELSKDLISIVGTDGYFKYANPAWERTLGYTCEEMLTRSIFDFIHPEDHAISKAEMESLSLGNETVEFENRCIHKDGSALTISWTAAPFEQEGQTNIHCIGRDITERKLTERELRIRDEAIQTALSAIAIADLQGNLTYVNKSFLEAWGFNDENEVLGRHAGEFWLEEEKVEEVMEWLQKQGTWFGEMKARTKSGSLFDVQVAASVVRDERDVPVGMMSSFIDITERMRAMKEREHYMEALERSNRELEEFAYVASHDLQEPLRMVSSYTQLLARRYQDQLDQDAHEFIAYATDGASRMQQLIEGLLSYSRISTKGKEFQPTDLESVLGEVYVNLKMVIEENNVIIIKDELPTVMADESQMSRLFQNLIENAIKYRGPNTPTIHVSAERKRDGWLISLKDNGIGIEPQYGERIFTIFEQLHKRGQYSGTGIGLSICKRIVERHGGKIWVESEPDNGSTFYFTLPTGGTDNESERRS